MTKTLYILLMFVLIQCNLYEAEENKLIDKMVDKSYSIDLLKTDLNILDSIKECNNRVQLFINNNREFKIISSCKWLSKISGIFDINLKNNKWIFKLNDGTKQENEGFYIAINNNGKKSKIYFIINN